MSFPQTRLTLIRRLATGGSDPDWRQFLQDYWGPICGFAVRWGRLSIQDAEDVAAKTFEVLLREELLSRWHDTQAARLRTLLCRIVRNVISNQARIERGRKRIREELAAQNKASPTFWTDTNEPTVEQIDTFYAAWADDVLKQVINGMLLDLHREGKGDYFRVLYGRICEELSIAETADLLGLKPTDVENYFKAAKKRFAVGLRDFLYKHVQRYSDAALVDEEFQTESGKLSEHLQRNGGLEPALKSAYQQLTESPPARNSALYKQSQAIFTARRDVVK